MRDISIKTMTTDDVDGAPVVVAVLDSIPSRDWADTFERSTSPAFYGRRPLLLADRITVDVDGEVETVGITAQQAVRLTNALVHDRAEHDTRPHAMPPLR